VLAAPRDLGAALVELALLDLLGQGSTSLITSGVSENPMRMPLTRMLPRP
jgi:hypothetical protein